MGYRTQDVLVTVRGDQRACDEAAKVDSSNYSVAQNDRLEDLRRESGPIENKRWSRFAVSTAPSLFQAGESAHCPVGVHALQQVMVPVQHTRGGMHAFGPQQCHVSVAQNDRGLPYCAPVRVSIPLQHFCSSMHGVLPQQYSFFFAQKLGTLVPGQQIWPCPVLQAGSHTSAWALANLGASVARMPPASNAPSLPKACRRGMGSAKTRAAASNKWSMFCLSATR
jgi:hypothetical protein